MNKTDAKKVRKNLYVNVESYGFTILTPAAPRRLSKWGSAPLGVLEQPGTCVGSHAWPFPGGLWFMERRLLSSAAFLWLGSKGLSYWPQITSWESSLDRTFLRMNVALATAHGVKWVLEGIFLGRWHFQYPKIKVLRTTKREPWIFGKNYNLHFWPKGNLFGGKWAKLNFYLDKLLHFLWMSLFICEMGMLD